METSDVRAKHWNFLTPEAELSLLAGDITREEFSRNRQKRAIDLVERFKLESHHRLFEIGSGDGLVASIVSGHCHSIDCNDVSRSFLQRARKNCIDCASIRFHEIGTNYLDHLSSNTYDFGYSLSAFIHFNAYDIFNYLVDVERILKSKETIRRDKDLSHIIHIRKLLRCRRALKSKAKK